MILTFKNSTFKLDKGYGPTNIYCTQEAYKYVKFADSIAKEAFKHIKRSVTDSRAESTNAFGDDELTELFPYQRAGVDYICRHNFTLLADEQGLGKTVQVIKSTDCLGSKKILIICPASLKGNWKKEFNNWSVHKHNIDIVEGGKHLINTTANVIIINYDLCYKKEIHKQLVDINFDFIAMDEAHYLKSPTAKRTRHILGWTSASGKTTIEGVLGTCKKIVVLTGTPVPNRPVELYCILATVFRKYLPASLRSYENFTKMFCGGYFHNRFGRRTYDVTGATNLDLLNSILRQRFMIRRLKKDVLPQLPDKLFNIIELNAPKGIRKLLDNENSIKESVIKALSTGGKLPPLEYMAEMRREIAEEKVKESISFIEDVLEHTEKVVIFAHHKSVITYLEEKLNKYGTVKIVGGVSNIKRDEAVESFQTGTPRVFLGNIQSAGVGITLTAASTVIFVEASWVSGENAQAVDRCHRIGQKNCVNAHFLVWEDSLDAQILKTSFGKQKNIERVMK